MLKIINGRKYNTETAERVGVWSNNLSYSDFRFKKEELYRKKTGEFFLYGEGGPMTDYAKYVGLRERIGGEKLIPLTFAKARAWAEEHLEAEEYEAIFGEVEETGEKKVVAYSLPVSAIELVKLTAAERGCSASDVITELIRTLPDRASSK